MKEKNTSEKIIEAAKELFVTKGYAATKTREIAAAAGINVALLNYHFKSKKNLFEMIMGEKFLTFFGSVIPIFNNENTSLTQKFEQLTDAYFIMLLEHPDLALFVVSEISKDPSKFVKNLHGIDLIKNSIFNRQVKEVNPNIEAENILLNLMSLIVFPFIMKPVLDEVFSNEKEELQKIIAERKQMIPLWMEALLNVKI